MKKLLVMLLSCLMCLVCFAGCSSQEEEETEKSLYEKTYEAIGKCDLDLSNADGVLAEILEKGTLTIATSPDFPAAEFIDEEGNVMGCEIMLAQYIANSLGVELEIETMDFGATFAAVDTGKADIGVSGYGWKEDRAEQYELSIGYQAVSSVAHYTLLVLKEDLDNYNSLDDFAGLTIDAQPNSLQEMYVQDQCEGAIVQQISTLDTGVLDLLAGKVAAVSLTAEHAAEYASSPDTEGKLASLFVEKGIEFDLTQYGEHSGQVILAKKGETSLMDAINTCIKEVIAQNYYYDWYLAACDAAGIEPQISEE